MLNNEQERMKRMKRMRRIIGVIVSVAFSFVIVMDNPTILLASLIEDDVENMVTIVA